MTRNAIDHLDAADELVTLIAVGLRMRHPQAMKMARIDLAQVLRLNDDQIDILTLRLEAWIAEQPGAIAAPRTGD